VDLVVLGASGTGALQRLLFGSTVMAVVRQSACPVLVVRR
jgi:nucleotide-binding universal stress UspA family protein